MQCLVFPFPNISRPSDSDGRPNETAVVADGNLQGGKNKQQPGKADVKKQAEAAEDEDDDEGEEEEHEDDDDLGEEQEGFLATVECNLLFVKNIRCTTTNLGR